MRTMRVVMPEENLELEAPANSSMKPFIRGALRSLGRSAIAGISIWLILPVVFLLSNLERTEIALIWAVATGIFVGPAILVVLWPLDVFLPRSSRLWHPGFFTLLGLIGGTVFLFLGAAIFGGNGTVHWEQLFGSFLGGGTYGALMALVLSLLNRRRK